MSEFASPATTHAERSLEVPLTISERTRIAAQLGSAMVAAALLILAFLQWRYGSPDLQNLVSLIVAVAALIVATPIFIEALQGLFTGDAHSTTEQLVALAILAAMMMGSFVTATMIAVIMNLGHFFEERSILGAQAAIDGLRKLHAARATLLTDKGEREVEADALRQGDVILLRAGDVIAADGEVIKGISSLDQSSITGESAPEDVGVGSQVYAATVNLTGLLHVRVTRTGEKTALGRVVELLQEAEQSQTPAMKLIERYAAYYVPVILIIAAVVLFITRDMSRAVTVMVVACPGALVLAGPTAMVASLATASRLGVLIKNTRFLESLGDVDTVVLDKTGTVTLGQLQLVGSQPCAGQSHEEMIQMGLACAFASRHPVSKAIIQAAHDAGIEQQGSPTTEEVAGKGVRATLNGSVTLLGRREWLAEQGAELPENPQHTGPIVWLGKIDSKNGDGAPQTIGCFLMADVPRPEAKQAIADLRDLGVRRSILLTGDRKQVADEIGSKLEVDKVIAEVLPEQKLQIVDQQSEAGHSVMMVGDGVNDALALARGDVGVALGAVASDVALKSADVALMTNDLGRLPMTVRLARQTRRTIHQNILVGAGLSIGFLWLASIGAFGPIVGGLLHFTGELFVIINSARLLTFGK